MDAKPYRHEVEEDLEVVDTGRRRRHAAHHGRRRRIGIVADAELSERLEDLELDRLVGAQLLENAEHVLDVRVHELGRLHVFLRSITKILSTIKINQLFTYLNLLNPTVSTNVKTWP